MMTSNCGKQQGRPTREAADPRVGERYSFIRRTYHRISGQPLFRSAAVLSCLFFSALPLQAHKLSELAATMVEGQWKELATNNINPTLTAVGNSGFVFGYSEGAPWDSESQKLFFAGGDHGDAAYRISYDANTNTWQRHQQLSATVMHGYDHSVVARGYFFHRPYASRVVKRWNIATGAEDSLPAMGGGTVPYIVCCAGMAYFPERDALIYATVEDGALGSVVEFPFATNAWRRLHPTAIYPMGELQQFVEYNPVHHVILFGGGGTKKIYKLTANGTITALADAPMNMGTDDAVTTVDPISGDYLVAFRNSTFFKYNITTDSWMLLPHPPANVLTTNYGNAAFGTVATPVPEHGVTAFVSCQSSNDCHMWLYKHAPGAGTPYVPVPPLPGTPAPAPISPAQDFQNRCSESGVIRCVGFDAASDFEGQWGTNHGLQRDGTTIPTQDSSMKASGGSSIKFTIPAQSYQNTAGSYFTNFSDDLSVQFGENSEFYVQWRQRFSPEFLTNYYLPASGWKQAIITTGDRPNCVTIGSHPDACALGCTDIGIVVQNTYLRNYPVMYHSCAGGPIEYQGFEEYLGQTDLKMQNARPAPYCLYSQKDAASRFPPNGNCVGYAPDEWMTFQVHVKVGPRQTVTDQRGTFPYFVNSHIDMWVAREGQPSEQIFNWGPYNLESLDARDKYGKVWLIPYHTNQIYEHVYPIAYTWYDELIISRHPIADPNGAIPPGSSFPPGASVNAGGSLNSVRVFPNPWRSDRHAGGLTFDNLPANTQVKIFTASGQLVKEYKNVNNQVTWDRTNTSGDKAASGVYLYVITAGDGQKKKGKVAIIK